MVKRLTFNELFNKINLEISVFDPETEKIREIDNIEIWYKELRIFLKRLKSSRQLECLLCGEKVCNRIYCNKCETALKKQKDEMRKAWIKKRDELLENLKK